MAYDNNYNAGYCSTCGSTNGCSCGCQGGYDYSSCSPDYNPVTVNNSTCPTLDSTSAGGSGGTASGNNSSVCVNVGGCAPQSSGNECCCKDGSKKLLEYLYKKAVDTSSICRTDSICVYGDIIPTDILSVDTCSTLALLSIPSNDIIQVTSITDDVLKVPNEGAVSICSISLIKFKFTNFDSCELNTDLRKDFFYTPKCKCGCNCDCGDGMAQALYLNGLGLLYTITLQDTLNQATTPMLSQGTLENVKLIAIDSSIAIFTSNTDPSVYVGVPTCRIAKFK